MCPGAGLVMPEPGQLIFRIRLQGQIFRLRLLARMLCAGLGMRYAQFRIFRPDALFKQQSGQPNVNQYQYQHQYQEYPDD